MIRRKRCVRCNTIVIVCFKSKREERDRIGRVSSLSLLYSLVSSNKYKSDTRDVVEGSS